MKKILVLLLTVFLFSFTADAQLKKNSDGGPFKPYVGAGASLSAGDMYYGAEVGIYNDKAWYAVGVARPDGTDVVYTGQFKAYYKLQNASIVDLFGYGTVGVQLDKSKAISFEPGFAAVFNITKKFAPQISLGFPMYEGGTSFKPLQTSFGLSLNYWIK